MDAIFHERQEGSLCAQHCLNALLQGSYFTAVDLAELARQLDETEKATMAEAGVLSEEYRRFAEQPSNNYDDSGFFSIQVLDNALNVWNLSLRPLKSSDPVAVSAREDPRSQLAYICNFREHWFCIRKLGNQWFNLNSLLTGPELVSDTFLQLLLKQLETEGYSIFIVSGRLPDCEADALLKLCPAVQPVKPKLITESSDSVTSDEASTSGGQFSGSDLQKALEESRRLHEEDDPSLQQALKNSMRGMEFVTKTLSSASQPNKATTSSSAENQPSEENIRNKRLAYLENKSKNNSNEESTDDEKQSSKKFNQSEENSEKQPSEMSEEEMLEFALAMSMNEDGKS